MKHFALILLAALTWGVNAQTTFNVDMTCAPEFDHVFVTGPFCGWCADYDLNTMTDDDGDGIYTVVIEDLAGTVEYKYAINGFAGQENLINDMVDGATCAPITDYSGYANRQTQAGSTTNDYYGTCDGTCNDLPSGLVTFQVDMAGYTGTFGTVNLNGSFNGWCGGCAVMTDDDGDGVYTIEVGLDGGTVEYTFTVDGWTDQEEFMEGAPCTSTEAGYTNRTLDVDGDSVLPVVCWGLCAECEGGCIDETACNFNAEAVVDDESCFYECPGCTIQIACNFDPLATVDDGSCIFYCPGCIDELACNYDSLALQDDGSCLFPEDLGLCNCDGGALDAIGVCGGDCFEDADQDGICDVEDDCVGEFDECGVCNGPGAIYDCGCEPWDDLACDCEGTLYDQCGVCGGDGSTCVGCTYAVACNYDPEATILDASLCEFGTCTGCTQQSACNYNPTLSADDGSCEWCSCLVEQTSSGTWQGAGEFPLTVESYPAVQEGLTTYRFYVNMSDPTDRMSAVYGNDEAGMYIDTPDGAFNSPYNPGWNAAGINPAFLTTFPEMADDTYATIGLTGPASTSGIADAADPSLVEDSAQPITPYFQTDGATALESNTLTGAAWYILDWMGNGLPDENLQVLILQVTTAGGVSGTLNYQVFPLGVGSDAVYMQEIFELTPVGTSIEGCSDDAAVNYCPLAEVDDGSCFYEYFGCLDEQACNYSATATIGDEALCVYIQPGACDCDGNALDECGVCGGDGIPEGQCDCEGNVLDAVGVCGGDCELDANGNGICDADEVGGPEACGWGTVWNADSAACVLAVPPFLGEFGDYSTLNPCYYDLDLSGSVGAGDLINFLSTYNLATGCSWTED